MPGTDAEFSRPIQKYLTVLTGRIFEQAAASIALGAVKVRHDVRLDSRRVITLLKLFGSGFPEKDRRTLRKELRKIIDALGAAREQDVFLELLEHHSSGIRSSRDAGLRLLAARHRTLLKRYVEDLAITLQNAKRLKVESRLRTMLKASGQKKTSSRRRKGVDPRAEYRTIIAVLRRKFDRSIAAGLERRVNEDELHEWRLAGKPLRFTLECLAPELPERFRELLQSLQELLRVLGKLHDLDLALRAVRDYSAEIREFNSMTGGTIAYLPTHAIEDCLASLTSHRKSLVLDFRGTLARWNGR